MFVPERQQKYTELKSEGDKQLITVILLACTLREPINNPAYAAWFCRAHWPLCVAMAGEPSQPTQPAEVLQTFSGKLFTAIRSPEALAQFMYSERLIGDDLLDDLPSKSFGEAKSRLLSAVRAAVRTSNRKENVMKRFLHCLEQSGEPTLGDLASEMRAFCPG